MLRIYNRVPNRGRRELGATIVTIQERGDGHADWDRSSQDGRKGYSLKVESREFPNKLDGKFERKDSRAIQGLG